MGTDLGNTSCLIKASGHHRKTEMNRRKSAPLVNYICRLSSANQNARHKHWIVFSAYKMGVALHCVLHHAVSNNDLYIAKSMIYPLYILFVCSVQCILDCLPASVSTETVYKGYIILFAVYSDDQLSYSCSNPIYMYNYISVFTTCCPPHTTFPLCNLLQTFPVVLSQNTICYHWLSMPGNSKIMHCGILLNMLYCFNHMMTASHSFTAYQGCYDIDENVMYIAYDNSYHPNTMYQCVETCRAREYKYMAISGKIIMWDHRHRTLIESTYW